MHNSSAMPKDWVLKKEAGVWTVKSPVNAAADSNGIERFLKILADAKFEREFPLGDKGLENYGLKEPLLSYNMSGKDGKAWSFEVGGKSPTGYSSYVKTKNDGQIYLANQYLYTATNKTLTDFRDRSLFVPAQKTVESIEVNWPQMPVIKVVRDGKDWQMQTPMQTKADTTEMNKYLSAWEQVRVIDFIDSPSAELKKALTQFGKGTQEYGRVRFVSEDKSIKEIPIVENFSKLYVRFGEDSFAEVDKHQIDHLKMSANDLQDRNLFSFVSTDVTEISIDGKAYERLKGNWLLKGTQTPSEFVQGVLVSLEFAKADRKLTPAQGESLIHGAVLHTVVIKEKGKADTEFTLWPTAGKNTLVLKSQDRFFTVSLEFPDILKPQAPVTLPTLGGEVKGEKS
ncbi:MAG: DUF4340 domain-containing protein [Proteobacteria bacterium]|nr:MAG: DUF4340 domain-containing protein [Pseudomonadota bacterium]